MAPVKKGQCEHEGCRQRSLFNFDGEKRARFCAQHKMQGMIEFIRRPKATFLQQESKEEKPGNLELITSGQDLVKILAKLLVLASHAPAQMIEQAGLGDQVLRANGEVMAWLEFYKEQNSNSSRKITELQHQNHLLTIDYNALRAKFSQQALSSVLARSWKNHEHHKAAVAIQHWWIQRRAQRLEIARGTMLKAVASDKQQLINQRSPSGQSSLQEHADGRANVFTEQHARQMNPPAEQVALEAEIQEAIDLAAKAEVLDGTETYRISKIGPFAHKAPGLRFTTQCTGSRKRGETTILRKICRGVWHCPATVDSGGTCTFKRRVKLRTKGNPRRDAPLEDGGGVCFVHPNTTMKWKNCGAVIVIKGTATHWEMYIQDGRNHNHALPPSIRSTEKAKRQLSTVMRTISYATPTGLAMGLGGHPPAAHIHDAFAKDRRLREAAARIRKENAVCCVSLP